MGYIGDYTVLKLDFWPEIGGNFASSLGGISGPKAARRRRSPAISEPPATAAPRSASPLLKVECVTQAGCAAAGCASEEAGGEQRLCAVPCGAVLLARVPARRLEGAQASVRGTMRCGTVLVGSRWSTKTVRFVETRWIIATILREASVDDLSIGILMVRPRRPIDGLALSRGPLVLVALVRRFKLVSTT